jgi:hypothetical protein
VKLINNIYKIRLIFTSQRFVFTKPMLFSDQTYGFLGQNLWFR